MSVPTAPLRRRRREDLHQSLAVAALDATDAMVVITDTDGVIQHVNRAFTEATGYTYEEAVGGNPKLLSSGQHEGSFYARLWQTVLSGEVWEGEVINRRRNGQLYTDRMTISPVYDAGGRLTHFVAVKRDVSARVQDLLAASPHGVLHLGAGAELVFANGRACELLDTAFEALLGIGWREVLTDTDRDWLIDTVTTLSAGDAPIADGQPTRVLRVGRRHLRAHVGALRPGEDTVLGCVVNLQDVTTEVEATAALKDRELFARTVIDTIDSPTAVVDGAGVIVHVNPAWRDGPAEDALIGSPVADDLLNRTLPGTAAGDDTAARFLTVLRETLESRREKARVVEHCTPGARPRWWQIRIRSLPVDGGGAVLTATDVTAMFHAQRRSAVDAVTDPLTGLRNRRGLDEGLEQRQHKLPFSLLFIDLDRFKPINDSYGHTTGDEVLRTVAVRINALLRDDDLTARFGGDEFIVALPATNAEQAAIVVRRLTERLEEPITIDSDTTLRIGASIGVVTTDQPRPVDELLQAADEAMYATKRERRSGAPEANAAVPQA